MALLFAKLLTSSSTILHIIFTHILEYVPTIYHDADRFNACNSCWTKFDLKSVYNSPPQHKMMPPICANSHWNFANATHVHTYIHRQRMLIKKI